MATVDNTAKLIAALLEPANRTFKAAAAAAGLSERTAYRLKDGADFQRRFDAAQGAAIDALAARLVAGLALAEDVYTKTMKDADASTSTRLRAADGFVALALRLYEGRTLERRIAALEKAAGVHDGND